MQEIKQINDSYFDWLKSSEIVREVGDKWVEITTPFLDRHNDHLQIYVRRKGDSFELTDGGYIISDLWSCGCEINSPRRQQILTEVLNGHGVSNNKNHLEIICGKRNFAQKKHSLIQAMLAVDDMFYTASSRVTGLFVDDVANWLKSIHVKFFQKFFLQGKSGYSYSFFAAIPATDSQPERILHTVNNPERAAIKRLIFEWQDVSPLRDSDSIFYPFINDSHKSGAEEALSVLDTYNVTGIPWSHKEEFQDNLSAA